MAGKELGEAAGFLTLPAHVVQGIAELGNERLTIFEPQEQLALVDEKVELDPTLLQELAETSLYQALPKVDVDPPTIDFSSQEDKSAAWVELWDEEEELVLEEEHSVPSHVPDLALLWNEEVRDEESERAIVDALLE